MACHCAPPQARLSRVVSVVQWECSEDASQNIVDEPVDWRVIVCTTRTGTGHEIQRPSAFAGQLVERVDEERVARRVQPARAFRNVLEELKRRAHARVLLDFQIAEDSIVPVL